LLARGRLKRPLPLSILPEDRLFGRARIFVGFNSAVNDRTSFCPLLKRDLARLARNHCLAANDEEQDHDPLEH
jgi:hypothetical protein